MSTYIDLTEIQLAERIREGATLTELVGEFDMPVATMVKLAKVEQDNLAAFLGREFVDKLMVQYSNGWTSKEIGEPWGLSATWVRKQAEFRGIKSPRIKSDAFREFVRTNAGIMSGPEIAKAQGVSHAAIKKYAQRNGISLRASRTQFPHNPYFFDEIAPVQAYVAGLIAADGTIYEDGTVALSLNTRDANVVESVRNLLLYKGQLIHDLASDGKRLNKLKLSIYGAKELASALSTIYNLTPRKTHTLGGPNEEKLDHSALLAYIGGVIEGDGYIAPNKNSLTLRLELASKRFVEWFAATVRKLLAKIPGVRANISVKSRTKRLESGRLATYYRAECHGPTARCLCKQILALGVTRMERKWSVAREKIAHHAKRDKF